MADDEFQLGSSSGNWWDSSRTRFHGGPAPASTALNSTGSFGWPTEMVDTKARSSMDSLSVSGSSLVFAADSHKLQSHETSSGGGSGILADPDLEITGLGLSSHAMEWNQPMFSCDEKAHISSFRTMLQEGIRSNANCLQDSGVTASQDHWRQKIYTASSDDSSVNDYKEISLGFSLDQHPYPSHISSNESSVACQGLATSFQMESAAAYGNPTMFQGLLATENQPQQSNFDGQSMNYSYESSYAVNTAELMPGWSKFPQFLRGSPPEQQQPPHGCQLQFSNNTPFWNATTAAMNDVRSSIFPSLQTQLPPPTFDDRQKNASQARNSSSTVKKTSGDASSKRLRNETAAALPAFKVRKEKMGDRITALQQLVSPFGKTDTASVLSEAIEYIKFLQEQVNVLSIPYMKSGAQHHQTSDKSKESGGSTQGLRSRGLCLVPISSTFPVTHETTVDFWTPTFGGTFR